MHALYHFIQDLPKADLHVHLEGTIEPEMLFLLAERNKVKIPYGNEEELRKAYHFEHLVDFLTVYYQGTRVIQQSEDFYDITRAYLRKAAEENTIHADIFIDPQTHLDKGITLEMILEGVLPAAAEAQAQYGITTGLILCFLRHRPLSESLTILSEIGPLKAHFAAVGLAAKELGYPPKNFVKLYEMADKMGLKKTAHAGEEGPASYIQEAIEFLHVDRIDHGNSILDDPQLVETVKNTQIPLTMCPLSNLHLNVIQNVTEHPIDRLLKRGLKVTINSDDPSYFGGYMNANLKVVAETFNWGEKELLTVTQNAFDVAYVNPDRRIRMNEILRNFSQSRT